MKVLQSKLGQTNFRYCIGGRTQLFFQTLTRMETLAANLPTKLDLTPRRHHGYLILIFIIGALLPPLGN